MSTSSQSEVRDVGESKQEALRALLGSLAPDGKLALPEDADVSKLAEKLDELLASKGGLRGAQASIPRDAQGRPLNEEGLPIVEIVEPIANDPPVEPAPSNDIASSSVSRQAPLSPLPNWALSPAALAARRRERDRILDILEREEEEELARETAANRTVGNDVPPPQVVPKQQPPQRLDQILRPRTNLSRHSPPTLAEAPRDSFVPSEHTAKIAAGPSTTATTRVLNTVAPKPKKQKSVSFADPLPPDHPNGQLHTTDLEIDWGDVVPAPFNPRNARKSVLNVMKELVVERSSDQLKVSSSRMGDSDDEDDTIEGEDDASQEESDAEVPAGALRPSEVSESESDDGEAEVAAGIDETDFDEAMLQREIALAYYARRNQIGSDVTSGPLFDSAEVDRISSDNDVDDLRSDMDKSTSHFRRSRLNGDPQALINSAVQFGKLVDGQLVAGQVADREVEASLDELTGGSSDPNKEDLTEKTIALLMHSGKAFQGQPTNPLLHSQHAHPQVSSSSATSSLSRSVVAPQPQPTPNPKSQPQPPTVPVISSTNKQKSTQPPGSIPAATNQAFPSMIIESGFGFDPAFQVAPKPRTAAAKTIAPMSETVKERSNAPSPHAATREQAKSRFAQASRTREAKSQLSPATPNAETSATALRGDVIERAAPGSRVQPPEPSKRISRFRAERAGYL